MIAAFAYICTSFHAFCAHELACQLEEVCRYAVRHGYLMVATFLDAACAIDSRRPGLQKVEYG